MHKNNNIKKLLLLILMPVYCQTVLLYPQEVKDISTAEAAEQNAIVWYFPLDHSVLLHDYHSNAQAFKTLDSLLNSLNIREDVDTVFITAVASPIASAGYNRKLTSRRGEAIRSYMARYYPEIKKECFNIRPIGVDWKGFISVIYKDTILPTRLQKTIIQLACREDISEDSKLRLLRSLGNTSTQRRLIKEVYPMLQYASVRFRMKSAGIAGLNANRCDTVYIYRHDTIYTPEDKAPAYIDVSAGIPLYQRKNSFYLALKSNLLYDAAMLPNLTLEAYLGKGWSVAIEGNWSWWVFGRPVQKRRYHRIQSAGMELRHWFGSSRPLRGHALGAYAMGGTYDIRLAAKDEYANGWLSNWSWSAGFSYAYSFPFGRNFNIELGLAAGYMGGKYHRYNYGMLLQQWTWRYTKNRNYLGITRAGISIVWLFASGKNN